MGSRFVAVSALLVIAVTSLVGCGRQPTAAIQPAVNSSESFKVQGEYELHYNAVRSDQLSADIARTYGISRNKNKVLLNLSVLHKTATGGMGTPVDAEISVLARNLASQSQNVSVRRVNEGSAIYYLGEISFTGTETLVFEITATPAGSSTPITATFTREFSADY